MNRKEAARLKSANPRPEKIIAEAAPQKKGGVAQNFLSPTDTLFAEDPYPYKFGDEIFDRSCVLCKSKFQTKLELNRCCSPDCAQTLLKAMAGIK